MSKIIINNQYYLEQQGVNYDLYKINITKGGTYKGREVEGGNEYAINMGYSMSMERCIQHVITDTIDNKHEQLTLKQYLEAYKLERQIITDSLKELNKSLFD